MNTFLVTDEKKQLFHFNLLFILLQYFTIPLIESYLDTLFCIISQYCYIHIMMTYYDIHKKMLIIMKFYNKVEYFC